jgi:hypothetical protein
MPLCREFRSSPEPRLTQLLSETTRENGEGKNFSCLAPVSPAGAGVWIHRSCGVYKVPRGETVWVKFFIPHLVQYRYFESQSL